MNLIHIHLSVSVKEDVISSLSRTCDKELYKTWALSIQRKLRFEISEIPHAQWNNTLRLHKLDPSHRTFGYYSSKQVTKERYWGQQFCQLERDISVRPNEIISDRSKWTIFKAGPEYSGRTKPKWSVSCYVPTEISEIFRNFGFNGKHPMSPLLTNLRPPEHISRQPVPRVLPLGSNWEDPPWLG